MEEYTDGRTSSLVQGSWRRPPEADKALAKVTAPSPKSRKRSHQNDSSDMHCFLSKGALSRYGSKGSQRQWGCTTPVNIQGTTEGKQTTGPRSTDRTSTSRESPILFTSVETDYTEPLGSGGGDGLSTRAGTDPLPDQPSNISGQIVE